MSIMGVDPGIANTGIAFIYDSEGVECLLCSELVRTKASEPITERISRISEKVRTAIIDLKPSFMFVEEVFFAKNKNSATTTSMVIGICAYLAHIHNIKFYTLKPNEVKKALTGQVKASKIEVAEAVKQKILYADDKLSHHVTDAIAIALTGAYKIDSGEIEKA
jgi:crossover junction endodeoxyribonuclease RuvC